MKLQTDLYDSSSLWFHFFNKRDAVAVYVLEEKAHLPVESNFIKLYSLKFIYLYSLN